MPNYSKPDDWERFNALGVTQYGQMTAGSYMYIGPQGIVHGTTITVLNASRMLKDGRGAGQPVRDRGSRRHERCPAQAGNIAGWSPSARRSIRPPPTSATSRAGWTGDRGRRRLHRRRAGVADEGRAPQHRLPRQRGGPVGAPRRAQ